MRPTRWHNLQETLKLSGQAKSLTLEDAMWMPLQRRAGNQVSVGEFVCGCVCWVCGGGGRYTAHHAL